MANTPSINFKNVGDTHTFTLHDEPVAIKVSTIERGWAVVWLADQDGQIIKTDDFYVGKANRLGCFMERARQVQDTFLINADTGYIVVYKGKNILHLREPISAVEILV